jgi:hypothetical protein
MGKGDHYRPVDKKKFNENFESIFGPRKIKTWNPGEDDEVGGEQGNGGGNPTDSGPTAGVPTEES